MTESTEVVIIGGGVAGCAVAYCLAKEGVRATVVEREGVGSQASGYSAGGLNSHHGIGPSRPLAELSMESFRIHRQMWEPVQLESGVDFHPEVISVVWVAMDESDWPHLEETIAGYRGADGFTTQHLDSDQLRELEPRLSPDALGGASAFGNVALDSHLYTVALSKAAESLGARVRSGRATGLETAGDRVTGVLLDDGAIGCDAAVVATGPWAGDAAGWLGIHLPVEPLKGEILRMQLPGPAMAHDFSWRNTSLFHRADGLVWVGTTEEHRGFDRAPSESARATLLEGATRLMPAIGEARLIKHTACLRPLSPDWLPIIGMAPGWQNVYLATGAGKKGILLAPAMGKAVTDLIVRQTTELSIEAFAPERFSKAAA